MKRAIVIALAVVTAAFAVQAGGFGGPMAMGMMPSFEGLNAELARYNDTFFGGSRGPEFSGPLFFIGAQGSGFIEGFSVGGWGAGFFKEATGDSCKVIMGYGMGYGEFGYRFNIADIVLIGPSLQLGGGGMGLHIGRYRAGAGFGSPTDDGTDNDEFFEDDESYDVGKGFVNAGACVDITFLFPTNERKTAFGGLNVKGGYLYPIYDSDWWDEHGYSIDKDAVSFNMDGPFVSVGVVFGGSSRVETNDDEWEEWE